ncbi:MAG: hypothetical protein AAF639_45745 [Chloroflexota bacterium]
MNNSTQFQIYGRTSYEQPLTFLKEIVIEEPDTEDIIKARTMAAVDETWIELIAVPTASLIHVTENA